MLTVVKVSAPFMVVSKFDAANETEMISVTFAEEGRTVVTDASIAFLNKHAGKNVGLAGTDRTCTKAIRSEFAAQFEEGTTIEGHINREWLDVNPYPNAKNADGSELAPREFTFRGKKLMGFSKTELSESIEDDTINFILDEVPSNNVPLKVGDLMKEETVTP
jgi:hypothetical protein